MSVRGVLVSCVERETTHSSGLQFDDHLVLTLATLLPPTSSYTASNKLSVVSSDSVFTVTMESADDVVKRRDAHLVAWWRCPLVENAVYSLLSDWQLTPDEDHVNARHKDLLSTFLVLQLDDADVKLECVATALIRLLEATAEVERGQEVVVESTLFGRRFFLNSWSEGVVSNRLGQQGCLLLTDARTGVGCEGGPIFLTDKVQGRSGLLGMVLCAVCWCRGEWVGFTLGVALRPVLRAVTTSPVTTPITHDVLGEGSVVVVRRGACWGSGVVVDAARGLILTCSHVVKGGMDAGVSVTWRGVRHAATVLHRTSDARAYDLALLAVSTPPPGWQSVHMRRDAPRRGTRATVVGWAMFSSPTPTTSRGVVARSTPTIMLQTTCCVQSGASGGAVMDERGALLGLVVCNALDHATGTLYPHVNMAVPTVVFADVIQEFVRTRDVAVLHQFESDDEHVQRVWRMNLSLSKL